jgi:hypothetical protein
MSHVISQGESEHCDAARGTNTCRYTVLPLFPPTFQVGGYSSSHGLKHTLIACRVRSSSTPSA